MPHIVRTVQALVTFPFALCGVSSFPPVCPACPGNIALAAQTKAASNMQLKQFVMCVSVVIDMVMPTSIIMANNHMHSLNDDYSNNGKRQQPHHIRNMKWMYILKKVPAVRRHSCTDGSACADGSVACGRFPSSAMASLGF